jgi:L-ascorbate metabolism protein UlaG (beta-lactamase superfamily)
MPRIIRSSRVAAFVAAALAGGALAGRAQSPASLRVTFIGNAAVSIVSGDRAVVTDFPYVSGAFGYMTYDRGSVRLPDRVVALVTHGHDDHFDPTRPRGLQWRVVAPDDVARRLRRGVVIGAAAASTEVPGLMVTPVTTPHANVDHRSYRVEWRGRRFHFTGDTEVPTAVLAERGLDIAFVTPWIWRAVQEAGRRIDAARVVIYHHTKDEVVPGCSAPCEVPAQGATWTLAAAGR